MIDTFVFLIHHSVNRSVRKLCHFLLLINVINLKPYPTKMHQFRLPTTRTINFCVRYVTTERFDVYLYHVNTCAHVMNVLQQFDNETIPFVRYVDKAFVKFGMFLYRKKLMISPTNIFVQIVSFSFYLLYNNKVYYQTPLVVVTRVKKKRKKKTRGSCCDSRQNTEADINE